MTDLYTYTIHLRVEVVGPDADPDEVAERLARRVSMLRRHDGFGVVSVNVDRPEDDGA